MKTPQTPAPANSTPLGITPESWEYTCHCGDSSWNDIPTGDLIGGFGYRECDGCGDCPYRKCECGYVEGNIPRASDEAHWELCPILNPELLED